MSTEHVTNRCPKCQAPLPPEAPQGLCPKCLLEAVSAPTDTGQPPPEHAPPPLEAVVAAFPQLEILELIGHGGMGAVYKARQPKLDRFVALKVLRQELAADPAFAERFHREAQVLARLNHPNIVTVYDYGQAGGFFFLLMEYVDGINLRQALQGGRFTPQQALMLVPKICEALQFAHDEGILHRDIKPENILLDTRGRIKIADFGIAKLVGDGNREKLTASGAALGTPHYMAPEQLEHPQDIDQRADIYSLGVVFYEMLTGELPIGRFSPPSAKTPVDPRVDEVVFRALEKEREKRYGSAREVKTQVEQITTAGGEPPSGSAKRRSRCYFSTPQQMRNCFPGLGAHIFTGSGELRLEAEALRFVSQWRTEMVIPLAEMAALGMGRFKLWHTPWVFRYAEIDYLVITWREGGKTQSVCLKPVDESSPADDAPVADWFEAIRAAVQANTGALPPTPAQESLAISAQAAWCRKGVPLFVAFILVWMSFLLVPQEAWLRPLYYFLFIPAIVLALANIWFSAGFLQANRALDRGTLDEVTSNDPPPVGAGGTISFGSANQGGASRRRSRWLVPIILSLPVVIWLAVVVPGMLLKRAQSNTLAVGFSRGVIEQVTLKNEERSPGLLVFRYKCSVPPRHVAIFKFVRQSNNVGIRFENLSGWIMAGPEKPFETVAQWSLQDGTMMSPELKDQERWDSNVSGAQSTAWTSKSGHSWSTFVAVGPRILRVGQTNHLRLLRISAPRQAGQPDLVQVEVTLEPLPSELAKFPGPHVGGGTEWLTSIRKLAESANGLPEK